MLYYLYNPSSDTDQSIDDIGLFVPFGAYIEIDSNDINGWMEDSSDLETAVTNGDIGGGTGDRGLTLHYATPPTSANDYPVAEALKRLSLSKDADLVMWDNSTANLPGSPTTVQEAIDALDGVVDDLTGTQWKEHVRYRVLTIAATPPAGSNGDVYVDTTNDPDEYYKHNGASWQLVGNVSDEDRIIVLDDTGGTYYQRIFVYDATGDSWSAVGDNSDNDAVIVNDDGDGKAAMYAFDTALDSGNGAWFKIADVDWGSPDLQDVYDAGDNTVTMSSGGGNVDWDLHDGGSWEVSTAALYMRVARATSALNWSASVSSLNFDIAGATSISATGGALTLETITSGNVNITSAGNLDFSISGTLDWNDGTNTWTPQQIGLRLANYTTGTLPSPPGVTGNYGAIAFDTTLDRPVVWVTDSDGGGTDGWLAVLLAGDSGSAATLDDSYDAYGASPATITIDDAEGQGSIEWVLTPSVGFTTAEFIISDGTNDFLTVGSTNAGDDYIDIKSIYNVGSGSGTGIDINDNNVQAGGTGGGISLSTTATAGTAGNISLDSEGNFTIEGDSASTVNVTGGNLTLSTTTSGDINLTSAAGMTVDLATNVTWQTSSQVWAPEQIGLRLANYATGGLPTPPGVTGNYGAIAFDTTRDAPVVWVTDSDGGGTDGWVEIITDQYDFAETLDEAYNNFGAVAPVVNIDAAEGQTTGLEWRLAADSDTMFVSDGTVPIVTFTRDSTAGASDGRVDIGDTAILGLSVKAAAPTAGAAAGDLFYNSADGLTYEYDGTRSKWLSTTKLTLGFGSRSADGQMLEIGGARGLQTGYRMPRAGTITAITAISSGGLATKTFRVLANGVIATPLISFNLTANVYTNASANINFSAGDYIGVFAAATGAASVNPIVMLEIAYRV